MDHEARFDLAVAYRYLAFKKLDDLTYTHLSLRSPAKPTSFYLAPFGLLFEEITPDNLLHLSFNGDILNKVKDIPYNATGYNIHSTIYQHRPDVNAILHLHTPAGIAVSAMEGGLLPISQHALHFYDRVAYHAYDSLNLHKDPQGECLLKDLGSYFVMFLENHGTLTAGCTLQEALFYTHHLERACVIQTLALQSQRGVITPSPAVCEQARKDLLSFEKNLGERDWQAILRLLDSKSLLPVVAC